MKKTFWAQLLCLLILFSGTILPQAGTYYDNITTSSPDFINQLKTRIRAPYTKIRYDQYDETMVAKYASRDTTEGRRVITCVYSGENYVYTPPFAWNYFSREHTWCHSWMPTYQSEDGEEYSDQHHLFPTNQNSANGYRSNHPLGVVSSATYVFKEGKFGTNADGKTVYEPRDSHKGDAARALLYMCIKYDGVNGTWNFNWLNNTRLPAIGEAPEDLNTLLEWNRLDPPDKWEIERNNYIQTIQQNRNPFVDHPEYVNYINFNDLTLLSPVFVTEPTNQLTNLTAGVTDNSITVKWTDAAAGAQAPSGYLILAYNKDNYFIPVDGTRYNDDKDFSDGREIINVPYSGADSCTFTNLKTASDYYFTVYAYNGSGSEINYKTSGTVPAIKTRTSGLAQTTVYFSASTATVNEGQSFNLPIAISGASPVTPTTLQVVLVAGDSRYVNGFNEQTVTFPAGSSVTQYVTLQIPENTTTEGPQNLTFSLKNATGGTSVQIGAQNTFTLKVLDNDFISNGGTETFAKFPETGISYSNGSFSGQDGSVWKYNLCSGNPGVQIKAPSPVLKKDAAASVTSGIIQGGCGMLSFKYMQSFSTNVKLGVYINDKLVATATSTGEANVIKDFAPISVNVTGPFTIRFQQIDATSGQVTIDDVNWTSNVTDVVEYTDHDFIPGGITLSQNYPNPCNPGATINYTLPAYGYMSLKVYNLIGMEVATLAEGVKGPGRYQVKFDGKDLASGIYLYKLTSGAYSVSKKLTLLK